MSELNTNDNKNINSENEVKAQSHENKVIDADYEIINEPKSSNRGIIAIAVVCGIMIIFAAILGYMCIDADLQRRDAIKEADKLTSEVAQLTEDNENLENELNSLQKQYETLEGQYNDLDKAYNELVDKNNSTVIGDNTSEDTKDNQDIESKPTEYVFKETDGVYQITANEVVKVFKTDKQQLKSLVNHEVEITGKVKKFDFADTTTILNKKVDFPATIKLDQDDMKSFKGIDCEFKDMTINSFIANNQDKLRNNCYVRIRGTASLGIAFFVNDCSSIEILDDSGNVTASWALSS